MAQTVKGLPAMRETQVWSLGWEDPLEKEMATRSSTLARKIPWTEEPARLQFTGLQRVGHDWATSLSFFPVCTRKSAIWGEKKYRTPCVMSSDCHPGSLYPQLEHAATTLESFTENWERHQAPRAPPHPPQRGRLAMSSESWAVGKKQIQYLLYPPERMWDFCLYQKGVWVCFFFLKKKVLRDTELVESAHFMVG